MSRETPDRIFSEEHFSTSLDVVKWVQQCPIILSIDIFLSLFMIPNAKYAQVPWGWMRRMSLQLPLCPLDLPQNHISQGPMVVSTSSELRSEK